MKFITFTISSRSFILYFTTFPNSPADQDRLKCMCVDTNTFWHFIHEKDLLFHYIKNHDNQ
jgi:hypothetical protein